MTAGLSHEKKKPLDRQDQQTWTVETAIEQQTDSSNNNNYNYYNNNNNSH